MGQLPNDGQDGADRLLGSDHEVRRGASCSGCRKQQHIKMGAEVTLPDGLMSALEILQFIMDVDCYPNVSLAYRILSRVPVSIASAERSLSKLKLLENYLRSTMLQDRLNDLAMCCIEKDMLDNVDLDYALNDSTSRNARRNFF